MWYKLLDILATYTRSIGGIHNTLTGLSTNELLSKNAKNATQDMCTIMCIAMMPLWVRQL